MPLLDQPFGWTWLLVIGWTGYRLLTALVFAMRQAVHLGSREPRSVFLFHLFGSAIVWAIFGALGWQTLFGPVGPISGACFGILTGIIGFAVGFSIDAFLAIRLAHRLAVRIVTARALTYAELLDLGDAEQRIRGAKAMAFIGPKALFAVPRLLVAWKDRDPELRYRVAIAFWCIRADDPAVVAAMTNGLADADSRVRVVAASLLVVCRVADGEDVLPILRAGLKIEEEIRAVATQAIWALGPAAAPAVPDLIALIGEDFNTNALVRFPLAGIGAASVPALILLLKSPSKKVRETAMDTLGDIGPPARKALPDLREMLHDSNSGIRLSAQRVIAKIEGKA